MPNTFSRTCIHVILNLHNKFSDFEVRSGFLELSITHEGVQFFSYNMTLLFVLEIASDKHTERKTSSKNTSRSPG